MCGSSIFRVLVSVSCMGTNPYMKASFSISAIQAQTRSVVRSTNLVMSTGWQGQCLNIDCTSVRWTCRQVQVYNGPLAMHLRRACVFINAAGAELASQEIGECFDRVFRRQYVHSNCTSRVVFTPHFCDVQYNIWLWRTYRPSILTTCVMLSRTRQPHCVIGTYEGHALRVAQDEGYIHLQIQTAKIRAQVSH